MKVTSFKLLPLKKSQYIFPYLATYIQEGKQKTWEVVKAGDSVAILLYHKQKDAFVVVKQFRPATYANGHKNGMSVELCAGLVDKPLSLEQIAIEEIEEECGYKIISENITKITSFYTSVGFAGSKQTLYYAVIDESMRVSKGGGIDDELIEVLFLSRDEAKALMFDEETIKTPGLLFAFSWWFAHHRS
ncbi:MAG: NUDIX domain-containing protein [Campylobacterales bacterium]|nr:NUDIX domain-containing protein [Campylobacterales bacterium]